MKLFRIALIFLIIIINHQDLRSQTLIKTSPDNTGMSGSRLERISAMLSGHVDRGELSGAVALVARNGKIAYLESFGFSDIENRIPMQDDSIFRMASMTKMFTSVAVMILYEEGNFNLNDPVSSFIPEFREMKVAVPPVQGQSGSSLATEPANREITIRDLLRHTSGLTYSSYYPHLNNLYKDAGLDTGSDEPFNGSLHDFIRAISSLPLAFHPGTKWEYSYATDVLGYFVEAVSGQPLDRFMEERIFKPLGLRDTGFIVDDDMLERFTGLYKYEDEKLELVESVNDSPFRKKPVNFSGGGGWTNNGYCGLVSTALDYTVMLQMLLNNGEYNGNRVLGRKTAELMLRDQLIDIDNNWLGPGVGFTLASAICSDIQRYGEYGSEGLMWWAGSCNTYFFFDPVEEFIGVLMTQMYPFGHLEMMGKFKILCYQAVEK
ncbi:serine hydrolase domain-containing protein [candidate division KSB1 bacterium]